MKALSKYILVVLSGLSFACGKTEPQTQIPAKGQAVPVTLLSLKSGDFSTEIQASGTFSTQDETLLSFKVGGIVSQILVNEGDPIKPGQILASLDLTEIQAGLAQARLGYEKALRDQQRAERLFIDSVATLEQVQNAKTALEIAEQQLKASQFNLTYSQIRAPKAGFVLRKFVNPGQQVSSGAAVLQVNGAASGNWVLQVTVNDQNWSQIREGDPATLLPANSSMEIPGKVIRKSQATDPLTGTYWVEISPEKTKGLELATGMFGKAIIRPSLQSSGWEIPFGALLDAQGDEGFVYVTPDGKSGKRVAVKIGKISKSSVQIVSGLEDYQELIVSGSAYLTDGSIIQIQKP
ncbi:MAG: efflux RND transporter periplasmic adaptor subunit [Algoriphagus aquaeductus]|uniref:efflux RND transporter periplasmic adaptor subunit n=1 Tax=Algoriphagus aquaeductus TaxID=475299 RepID=UPI003918B7F9